MRTPEQKAKAREYARERYRTHGDEIRAMQKRNRDRLKLEVLAAYGTVCSCCGEGNPLFLTIDHLNGDGKAHRVEARGNGAAGLYPWLRRQGFPQDLGLVVACFNCNSGRAVNGGVCPHVEEGKARNLTPAHLQRNVWSLSSIGGGYDIIATEFERRHAYILGPWRAVTGEPDLEEIWSRSHRLDAPTRVAS